MRLVTFNILHGRSLRDDGTTPDPGSESALGPGSGTLFGPGGGTPFGPADGSALGPADGVPSRPRLATTDDGVDVDRFAKTVHALDADVLALQEVDRNQPRSRMADLTAVAADAMGATEHRFVAALCGSPDGAWTPATGDETPDSTAYGIALVSRYPVTGWQVVRLPAVPVRVPMLFRNGLRPTRVRDEPRVAVAATMQTPYGVMSVVSTHLSFLHTWNGHQLRTLARGIAGVPRPLVLMGDLNMGPSRARVLTGMRPLAAHPTFPADRPRRQLDHILLDRDPAGGGLPTPVSVAVRLPLSDHRALVAEFPGS